MIIIRGHLGFGDCIHQRAIIRTLMDDMGEQVVLETFYNALYHDFRSRGLKLVPIGSHPPRVRERVPLQRDHFQAPPGTPHRKLGYSAALVHEHGSILAAQYHCCLMKMPARPDFSLPVPAAWRAMARDRIGNTRGKPVMVYRPTVLNNLFHCEQRLPDFAVYARLYERVRDQYHVVSVCNLGNYGEVIAGPEMDVDVKYHHGELRMEELAGVFAEADLAFTCAGYAPVLAQAVGVPTVIVYGGHEVYASTNIVGAHLAPTLAIEPINPCNCHGGHYRHTQRGLEKPQRTHECDKTTDVELAITRLDNFIGMLTERQRAHA